MWSFVLFSKKLRMHAEPKEIRGGRKLTRRREIVLREPHLTMRGAFNLMPDVTDLYIKKIFSMLRLQRV